jgi:hypothetical protein
VDRHRLARELERLRAAATAGAAGVNAERDTAERIRTLLLSGDNVLKLSGDRARLGRALEAFKQAEDLAAGESVDPHLRDLVARRIASVRDLLNE